MGGLGLSWVLGLIVLFVAFGVVYQRLGSAGDAKRMPPPGRRINIGGVQLHIDVSSGPEDAVPVIFDAGIGATSLSWRLVQPEVARWTTAASYDRAGLGWSDYSSEPREVWRMVEELRVLLDRAKIAAPRILVAHSYGGLIALGYTSRYPAEVARLVLVDPVGLAEWAHPDAGARSTLTRAIFLARCGQMLAAIGVVRFTLNRLAAGARRMPQVVARATSGRGGADFIERMVGQIRKLPRELWPVIQAHWSEPKCFRAIAAYLKSLPSNAAEVLESAGRIGAPLIVLSAENSSAAQRADHERFALLSARGRMTVVQGSGHWIQLDQPEAVVQAIREIV